MTLLDDIFSWGDHPLPPPPPPPSSSSSSHFSSPAPSPTESRSRLSINPVMRFRCCWFSESLSRFYSEDKLCFHNIWWGEAASSIYAVDICFYWFFFFLHAWRIRAKEWRLDYFFKPVFFRENCFASASSDLKPYYVTVHGGYFLLVYLPTALKTCYGPRNFPYPTCGYGWQRRGCSETFAYLLATRKALLYFIQVCGVFVWRLEHILFEYLVCFNSCLFLASKKLYWAWKFLNFIQKSDLSRVVSYSKSRCVHPCWAARLEDGYSVYEMQIGICSFLPRVQK